MVCCQCPDPALFPLSLFQACPHIWKRKKENGYLDMGPLCGGGSCWDLSGLSMGLQLPPLTQLERIFVWLQKLWRAHT